MDSVLLLALRGGLVAASAAHERSRQWVSSRCRSASTFGTLHAGTPLVLAGENLGDLAVDLIQIGSEVAGKAMGHDALGWIAGQAAAEIAGFHKASPTWKSAIPIAAGTQTSVRTGH